VKERLKKHWEEFKQGQPGRRFQERYQQKLHTRKDRHWSQSLLEAVLILVFILIGLILVFIPGPAILFFALAAVLLAHQSLWAARLLDWTEVKLRQLIHWAISWWKRAPAPTRGAIIILGMLGIAGAGYCGYQLLIPD
jgi:hypothetical protein